jgi:hypothetical protein
MSGVLVSCLAYVMPCLCHALPMSCLAYVMPCLCHALPMSCLAYCLAYVMPRDLVGTIRLSEIWPKVSMGGL